MPTEDRKRPNYAPRRHGTRTTLQIAKGRLSKELRDSFNRRSRSVELGRALLQLWAVPFQSVITRRKATLDASLDKLGDNFDELCAAVRKIKHAPDSDLEKLQAIARLLNWQFTAEDRKAARETTRFAGQILSSPRLNDIVPPPALDQPKRRTYNAWPLGLLYMISLDVCGLRREGDKGPEWNKHRNLIDAAAGGLAEELYAWRNTRRTQLSEARYNSLSIVEASAWFDWLAAFAPKVNAAATMLPGETGKEGIWRAAALILAKTDEVIEYEAAIVHNKKQADRLASLSDSELPCGEASEASDPKTELHKGYAASTAGSASRRHSSPEPVDLALSPEPSGTELSDLYHHNAPSLGYFDPMAPSGGNSHHLSLLPFDVNMPNHGSVGSTYALLPHHAINPSSYPYHPMPIHSGVVLPETNLLGGHFSYLATQQPGASSHSGFEHYGAMHYPHDGLLDDPYAFQQWNVGHSPRVARRIARKFYGIDPDEWARRRSGGPV
ncbi:hypothetical protein JCM10908_001379 [Rhodotorula pacifica]|uniref:uncharacterized protein n=1 Tax=Rhodotorula pacifica TaxID=1495444 RepID=UPI003172EE9D